MKAVTKIRLIACDLDGTLLNSRREACRYDLDVLHKTIKRGYWVVPTTGRPLGGIIPDVRNIPGLRYCIMSNGATIYDFTENRYIYRKFVSRDAIERVIEVAKRYDISIDAVIDGRQKITQEHLTRVLQKYTDPYFIRSFIKTRDITEDLLAEVQKASYEVEKFNIDFLDDDLMFRCLKIFSGINDIEISRNEARHVEITASGCNKGAGLDILARHIGLKNSEIMVIGDSDNDLPMFTAERFCVAMANAEQAIKDRADYITDTNDRNGVGRAIERLLFRDEDSREIKFQR